MGLESDSLNNKPPKLTNQQPRQPVFHDALILSDPHLFSSTDNRPTLSQVARGPEQEYLQEYFCTERVFFSLNMEGAKAHALCPSGQVSALCTEG